MEAQSPNRALMSRALPLFAVAVLVLNDHILKQHFGATSLGVLTGKISDFAGLFFFPLFLTDAVRLFTKESQLRKVSAALIGACIATTLVFALVKTTMLGHEIYCVGLGALQWPFRMLAHRGHGLLAIRRVRMTMDATDLVALASIPLAYVYATRCLRPARASTGFDGAAAVPGPARHELAAVVRTDACHQG